MKTEEEWEDRFGPSVDSEQGSSFFNTFGEDRDVVLKTDPRLVWLVGSQDNGSLIIRPYCRNSGGFEPINPYVDVDGFAIAAKPITDDELRGKEWEDVLWADFKGGMEEIKDNQEEFDTPSAVEPLNDPTDTGASSLWFDRFGGLVTPDDLMSNGNDDGNWSFDADGEAAIRHSDPNCLWTVVKSEESGDLFIVQGLDRENAVNFIISENSITEEEKLSQKWSKILWYSPEPKSTPTLNSGP